VKNGGTAAFLNIGLVIAFMTDIIYFGRPSFWTDYLGTSLIVLSTTAQALISKKENDEIERDGRNKEGSDDDNEVLLGQ
jgi:hypothetical protein